MSGNKVPDSVVERLKQVAHIVSELDETIQPQAFELFREYILAGAEFAYPTKGIPDSVEEVSESSTAVEFFSSRETNRPAEAATLCAAYHYSMHGSQPFNTKEIEEIAAEAGLIIPRRLDKTFQAAKREGKTLFRQLQRGKGYFQPTMHGEAFFTRNLGVRKGRIRKGSSE